MSSTNPQYLAGALRDPYLPIGFTVENMNCVLAYAGGTLVDILRKYSIPAEFVTVPVPGYLTGALETKLISYANWQAESISCPAPSYLSGTLV